MASQCQSVSLTEPIVHNAGWLEKSPPLSQPKSNWKNRYFQLLQCHPDGDYGDVFLQKMPKKSSNRMRKLYEYYLVYWENDNVKKQPVKAIPLLGTYHVAAFVCYEGVYKNVISLTTNDRIYLFRSLDEAEMHSWRDQLTTAIENVKRKSMLRSESYVSMQIGDEEDRWFSSDEQSLSRSSSGGNRFTLRRSCSVPSVMDLNVMKRDDRINELKGTQDTASSQIVSTSYSINPYIFDRSALSLLQKKKRPNLSQAKCEEDDFVNESTLNNGQVPQERDFNDVTSDIKGDEVLQSSGSCVNLENKEEPIYVNLINTTEVEPTNNINYTLSITEESMEMACFQHQVKKLIKHGENIIREGLHVEYSQYELTIKKK